MNDDKAVKEVAKKLGFRVNGNQVCTSDSSKWLRGATQQEQEFWNLCVSLTRELQAIREAAEKLIAKKGGKWHPCDPLLVALRAALEGK